jgi:hypothetical protein
LEVRVLRFVFRFGLFLAVASVSVTLQAGGLETLYDCVINRVSSVMTADGDRVGHQALLETRCTYMTGADGKSHILNFLNPFKKGDLLEICQGNKTDVLTVATQAKLANKKTVLFMTKTPGQQTSCISGISLE